LTTVCSRLASAVERLYCDIREVGELQCVVGGRQRHSIAAPRGRRWHAVCLPEIGALQLGVAEVGALEIGIAKQRALHVGMTEHRTLHLRTGEVGLQQ
jgi:hypothetical protein